MNRGGGPLTAVIIAQNDALQFMTSVYSSKKIDQVDLTNTAASAVRFGTASPEFCDYTHQ